MEAEGRRQAEQEAKFGNPEATPVLLGAYRQSVRHHIVAIEAEALDAARREQAGLREAAAALVVEWDRSVPVLSDMTTVVRLQTGQLTGEAASVMRLRDSVDALRAALDSTPESGRNSSGA